MTFLERPEGLPEVTPARATTPAENTSLNHRIHHLTSNNPIFTIVEITSSLYGIAFI